MLPRATSLGRSGQQKSKPPKVSWPGRPALRHAKKGEQRSFAIATARSSYLRETVARSEAPFSEGEKGGTTGCCRVTLPGRGWCDSKGSVFDRQVSETSFAEGLYVEREQVCDQRDGHGAAYDADPRSRVCDWTCSSECLLVDDRCASAPVRARTCRCRELEEWRRCGRRSRPPLSHFTALQLMRTLSASDSANRAWTSLMSMCSSKETPIRVHGRAIEPPELVFTESDEKPAQIRLPPKLRRFPSGPGDSCGLPCQTLAAAQPARLSLEYGEPPRSHSPPSAAPDQRSAGASTLSLTSIGTLSSTRSLRRDVLEAGTG